MTLQELPHNIQSMFCASKHITSYKQAVEELIYNALDAGSTSIAIRIHIAESSLQILDNGLGISKNDFKLLGQRYATSKCFDLSTLRSAPNKYGFRGQTLASLIDISEEVKITSRIQSTDETWLKIFVNGKENKLTKTLSRPSKGTTVDIKGFLYNQNVRKKAIDEINELNTIKTFLEQLSLVHYNVSVSLRDDAKNEIIYKLHKNKDIYQTLTSVLGIDKSNIQHFEVEKNDYKVTAFIGKRDAETKKYHWIYLNGKFVNNNKLYKVINENLMTSLGNKRQNLKKCKIKNKFEDERIPHKMNLPCYFIFLTCPYYDYDVSYTPNQAVLEFKNWNQIIKILKKLISFYVGDDMNLKLVAETVNKKDSNHSEETREQVKEIIEKILGSNIKKVGGSHMHNGVKGKLIKRKQIVKKKQLKNKIKDLSISKALIPKTNKLTENNVQNGKIVNNDAEVCDVIDLCEPDKNNDNRPNILKNVSCNKYLNSRSKKDQTLKTKNQTLAEIKRPAKTRDKPKHKNIGNDIQTKSNVRRKRKQFKLDPLARKFDNSLITNSIKRRCDKVATKVQKVMQHKKKQKYKISVNKRIEYSSIIRNNKSVSVRQKIDEIVIQDFNHYEPLNYSPCTFDNRVWVGLKKRTLSSHDLLQTVINSDDGNNAMKIPIKKKLEGFGQFISKPQRSEPQSHRDISKPERPVYEHVENPIIIDSQQFKYVQSSHRLTYESHKYEKSSLHNMNYNSEKDYVDDETDHNRNKQKQIHFITKQSRDNFIVTSRKETYQNNKTELNNMAICKMRTTNGRSYNHLLAKMYNNYQNEFDTSYSIEVENTGIGSNNSPNKYYKSLSTSHQSLFNINNDDLHLGTYTIENEEHTANSSKFGSTYTVFSNTLRSFNNRYDARDRNICEGNTDAQDIGKTYTIEESDRDNDSLKDLFNSNYEMIDQNKKVVFVSKSQNHEDEITDSAIDPMNLCETEMRSNELCDKRPQCMDAVFQNDFSIESLLCDRNIYGTMETSVRQLVDVNMEAISHHFVNQNCLTNQENQNSEIDYNEENNALNDGTSLDLNVNNEHQSNAKFAIQRNNFDLQRNATSFNVKNRLRFIPKGLSQIFENCQTKINYDVNIEKDYYGNAIYNFADDVETNAGIFETKLDNLKELTTKDLQKLNKYNASLTFNGASLKHAVVLNQIEDKFIAAKVKSKSNDINSATEHLVLFDQHAVDERIRLERNLADYLIDNEWKSITLDEEISLKLSEDEILYLHNYKNKFAQFGLQWTISENCVVTINAIPVAILGKNPRQVEIVMKAVKNLILEEIQTMKSQKGCVTMYPKSIMDLVFSEACRYAIKFGDKLSKEACVDLLGQLSECKTPFQCAHGRPVMAVLIDLEVPKYEYKANKSKIREFLRRPNNVINN